MLEVLGMGFGETFLTQEGAPRSHFFDCEFDRWERAKQSGTRSPALPYPAEAYRWLNGTGEGSSKHSRIRSIRS